MFYYVICVCLGYGNFEVLVELMFCLCGYLGWVKYEIM